MYAIVDDGGQQLKVEPGQELEIDYRDLAAGSEVKFERVLAYRDDAGFRLGQPLLDSVTVTAQVLGVSRGPKLYVQKFRRRKTYRRRTGHRQFYTRVKISQIAAG